MPRKPRWPVAAVETAVAQLRHIISTIYQVVPGGLLRAGKEEYGSGTGWLFEITADNVPRMDVGSPTSYYRFDGTTSSFAGDGSGVTNIDGGNIQTGTVTATQITVENLQALSAQTGALTVDSTLTIGAGGIITWASGNASITDQAMIFDISEVGVPGYAYYYQVSGANRAYVYAQTEANRTLFATEVFGPADTKYGQWTVICYEWNHGGADEESTNVEFTIRSDTGVLFAATDSPSATFVITGMNVGLGATPTAKMDINSDILRLRTAKTPASAGAAGNQGDICWDANYIYACVATNTWKRAALATW